MILIFYVDDIVLFYHSKDKHLVDEFELQFLKVYEVRIIGDTEYFLGIRIVRDYSLRKIWLLQDSYIDKLAEKFDLTASDSKKTLYPIRTLLLSEELFPYEEQATDKQIYSFQQKIGSANFAAITTRPDISKATSKLSEFLRNLLPKH